MNGEAHAVRMARPKGKEGLACLLRHLADHVERGEVDPQDVLYAVDEPEGLFICSMELPRILANVWHYVHHTLLSFPEAAALAMAPARPTGGEQPHPDLTLEG